MSDALVATAIDAARQAYAPYSHFHVGAALELDDGSIVTGANFVRRNRSDCESEQRRAVAKDCRDSGCGRA
jgi:cytidine deaminase